MQNKINRFLLILCASTMLASVGRGERPNIIMFLIDDQNPSSIAAFGGNTYTPNIDRMAKEGMKFTRAYVSSSVCTPSRYSFLTCLLYTSPSPRDPKTSRMPSSA